MITAADLREQRNYIYGMLAEKLPECNFVLKLKVHQATAMFEKQLNPDFNGGYCHGYSAFWQRNLLLADATQILDNACNTLGLLDEIQALQRQHVFSYAVNRFLNHSVRYIANPKAMCNVILQQCLKAKQIPGTMLVLGISKSPTFSLMKVLPQLQFTWHELRFYNDPLGYLHWFDANVGWLVSSAANPSPEALGKFLNMIFSLMQYDEYKMVVRFDSYKLEKPKRILPRLGCM